MRGSDIFYQLILFEIRVFQFIGLVADDTIETTGQKNRVRFSGIFGLALVKKIFLLSVGGKGDVAAETTFT